jgi:nitrogen fixation/metabolism regulation signal transduction histidine kinase
LSDYLAEKRYLLGMDFLLVTDTSGNVIADSPAAPAADVPALAAAAPILYQGHRVGIVRGGVLLDVAFLAELKQASGVDLVLQAEDGQALAATLDVDAGLPPAPGTRIQLSGRPYLTRSFALDPATGAAGRVVGLVSTASADQTIAALRTTSLLLGALGLAIAVALGMLWSSQLSRPVERLAAFSEKIAQGDWDEPLTLQSVRELQRLVSALDRMRGDLLTYREKLKASERQAAWSQMARKVAHEVKNPLTPIAVSIADLKRSFEQHRPDFPQILDQAVRTIGDEVQNLNRLLQEFSDFGRLPKPVLGPCHARDLVADLETLYGREVAASRLSFAGPPGDLFFAADRAQLRQALVNLVKNALEATEGQGKVEVSVRARGAVVEWAVSDTGPGMSEEERARLFVPELTTKSQGAGLGLTIVERIVSEHHGTIVVDSAPGHGTTVSIRLPVSQEG